MKKKLFLSRSDRKVCGVCGGLATYINIDSTIIRIIWILLIVLAGVGLIPYIICALIMPDEPVDEYYHQYNNNIN